MSWILLGDYSPRRSVGLSTIGGGPPLSAPRRHRLGKPLPYQLADIAQAFPLALKLYQALFEKRAWTIVY